MVCSFQLHYFLQDGADKPVNEDDLHKITNVPKKTTLDAKNCVRKDTGIYTITVQNKHGKDDASLEIVVLGECVIRSLTFFSLSWLTRINRVKK